MSEEGNWNFMNNRDDSMIKRQRKKKLQSIIVDKPNYATFEVRFFVLLLLDRFFLALREGAGASPDSETLARRARWRAAQPERFVPPCDPHT